jgi:hypothetical protein
VPRSTWANSSCAPARWTCCERLRACPRRFPALARFLAAGVFEIEDGPDNEYVFGLDRILDGVEVLIQR